jgi:hypothetical protein
MGSVYNWQNGLSEQNLDIELSRQIFFSFRHLLISANAGDKDH